MNPYLFFILLALAGQYLLELAADWLNVRHLRTSIPGEFSDCVDAEKYRKSQEYLRDNTRFGIVTDTFNLAVTVVFILAGGFNWVDGIARHFGLGPIPTGLVFAGILLLAAKIINLPFSIYDTFVLEQKYGFNKTTPKTFVLDIIKGLVLVTVIGGAVFSVILWLFGKTGSSAWIYCWVTVSVIQVFLVFIAPYVIMPLFNKFIPMEDGELKSAIENYARSQDFRMKGVFKMDGSRRSAKTNAFFTGFGKSRRIVLFDTLIEKHTVPELVSIVAHEMGHYKKKHIQKALVRSTVMTGLVFFLVSFFINNRRLFDAFGMEQLSIYASLCFFGFLYAPVETAVSLVENFISRKHEYEADAYAAGTTGNAGPMVSGLKKLAVDNLSNLTPHPFKVFLAYSHPPVLQRINALRIPKSGAK
jgi:STE24 endopeptidase